MDSEFVKGFQIAGSFRFGVLVTYYLRTHTQVKTKSDKARKNGLY